MKMTVTKTTTGHPRGGQSGATRLVVTGAQGGRGLPEVQVAVAACRALRITGGEPRPTVPGAVVVQAVTLPPAVAADP